MMMMVMVMATMIIMIKVRNIDGLDETEDENEDGKTDFCGTDGYCYIDYQHGKKA